MRGGKPVHDRHHDVHQDDVVAPNRGLLERVHRFLAVCRLIHGESHVVEHVRDDLHVQLVVLGYQGALPGEIDLLGVCTRRLVGRIGYRQGNLEIKRAAMPQAAVRADAIAHHEHDAVADSKPQARALLAGVRGVYLLELGEDALDVLLGDAHAPIGDGEIYACRSGTARQDVDPRRLRIGSRSLAAGRKRTCRVARSLRAGIGSLAARRKRTRRRAFRRLRVSLRGLPSRRKRTCLRSLAARRKRPRGSGPRSPATRRQRSRAADGGPLLDGHRDRASIIGVLHGVAYQVDEHLAQAQRVAHEPIVLRSHIHDQLLVARGKPSGAHGVELLDHVAHAEGRIAEQHLVVLDLRHVQDAVEQIEQVQRRRVHLVQAIDAALVALLGLQGYLGHADDAVHRRADLVRHARKEVGLRLRRLVELLLVDAVLDDRAHLAQGARGLIVVEGLARVA